MTEGSPSNGDRIHGTESNLDAYPPVRGTVYRATDTGRTYVGDGSDWIEIDAAEGGPSLGSEPFRSIRPPVRPGKTGFASVDHDLRSRLASYEGGYTKPVFHLTFDGGADNNHEFREVFEELGVTPTLALTPAAIGDDGKMTWDQVRELQREYGWRMSNHGHRHDRFDEIDPPEQEREIDEGIDALQREQVHHDHYMYSWGKSGGRDGRSIVASRYPFAWGTVHAPDADGIVDVDSPYELPRVLIEREEMAEIEAAIDRAIENETGMVFFGHNVTGGSLEDEDGFETSVEKIESIVEYVRERGGEWVDSLDEVLRYSATPVRLSAGREPVHVDDLEAGSITAETATTEKIGAMAYQSNPQTIEPDGSTTVSLDSTRFDHRGEFDDERDGITVTVGGTYELHGAVTVAEASAGAQVTLSIRRNDDVVARATAATPSDDGAVSTRAMTHAELEAGDRIEMALTHDSSDAIETDAGADSVSLAVLKLG
ncbi:polysaccharide deacetylase family protein [Natrarchaeobius chitinivorans]|uniref:NodB homology domain-containing protein n=1 Tax=Natrarchaeobius chitinivorans TaxID=1679083 RepID=A0A3N6LZZ2_NATCH|nr:polysaccharide deacetylase family protein [Natrarchaeobius chitinivorans]RQG94837.1 hypothetical protein EA473_10065 [Natrarchaeobius chitinivorans]